MGRVCDGLARGLARPARIPALTPPGHLVLAPTDEVRTLSGNCETWILRFSLAAATGGVKLGTREAGTALPAVLARFAGGYVTTLCTWAGPTGGASPAAPSRPAGGNAGELTSTRPPMTGDFLPGLATKGCFGVLARVFQSDAASAAG